MIRHVFHRDRHKHHPPTSLLQEQRPEEAVSVRRHLVDVPYLLPKDLQEIHRLDFQHYALRAVIGSDYVAPINQTTQSILDVGCGTGRWAIEVAKAFPHAQVCGVDIELPTTAVLAPANCHFYQGNILKGIPFQTGSFDYVYQRLLVGAIPADHWPAVIKELVRIVRPGGFVELLESGDAYHHLGPMHTQLLRWWQAGITQEGFDLSLMPHLGRLLAAAGLESITTKTYSVPLGKWAGRVGEMMSIDLAHVLQSFRDFFVTRLKVEPAAFDQTITALPQEWEHYHTTYDFYLAYGQKPLG